MLNAHEVAEPSPDRFWRVRVDCWYSWKPKGKEAKKNDAERVVRWFIVQAPESDAAMASAVRQAQATAEMGPRWLGFEALQAATVKLPAEVGRWP